MEIRLSQARRGGIFGLASARATARRPWAADRLARTALTQICGKDEGCVYTSSKSGWGWQANRPCGPLSGGSFPHLSRTLFDVNREEQIRPMSRHAMSERSAPAVVRGLGGQRLPPTAQPKSLLFLSLHPRYRCALIESADFSSCFFSLSIGSIAG